ncbi:uncharacterized protein [Miscanthus floridulus]|uniref:uncharacterized protein n=1 Tax=Miscanthus floridulus TaxID=154761 RepID=UPI0034598FC3
MAPRARPVLASGPSRRVAPLATACPRSGAGAYLHRGPHPYVKLLRSQGKVEVVMWDPSSETVVAMDIEGRTTRTIRFIPGSAYYADFIPYVWSLAAVSGSGEEPVRAEPEYLGDPDRLPRCCGSACTTSPRHYTDPPWPR